MLILNLIRALLILSAVGLYHIYNHEFLTMDQGAVVFAISFFGLMLWEIIESYVINAFNGAGQTTREASTARWLPGPSARNG